MYYGYMDTNFDLILIKVRKIIADNKIPADDIDRVETLISNKHLDPSTVTVAVVKRTAHLDD
jgi:hypothetical protein